MEIGNKNQKIEEPKSKASKYNLIKKFGVWGFIFFLAKGLVWLGLFLGIGSIFA